MRWRGLAAKGLHWSSRVLGRKTPLYCSFGDILSKPAQADTPDHSLIDGRVALAD